MPSRYDQLLEHTIVVADTGDVDAIEKIKPQDATTNPSLITKAAVMPNYSKLINDAVAGGKGDLSLAMDKVSVNFGIEITKIVPGYVSTEVDARLSFDTDATIEKARALIDLYKEKGIDKSRILIKIAATWEGIMAAKVLEAEGITCNLTLIFSLAQAIACAEAGVTLISPFVGRIMDFYKKEELAKDEDFTGFAPETDPGVVSVKEIYNYYKKHGYNTIVMGASFRNVDEIIQLVGCDRLTISPSLIDELKDEEENNDTVEKQLDATKSIGMDIPKIDVDEKKFRMMMCMNPMATEKLAEGIRGFSADLVKLETIISEKLKAAAATAASDDEEEAASDDEEEAASDDEEEAASDDEEEAASDDDDDEE